MSITAVRRRHASTLITTGVNFFDVANAYGITPRVLLAWLKYERGMWENDLSSPTGSPPDETYSGEWPSEEEELSQYVTMGLAAEHFSDSELRDRYLRYREMLVAHKRRSNTGP